MARHLDAEQDQQAPADGDALVCRIHVMLHMTVAFWDQQVTDPSRNSHGRGLVMQ